MQIAQQFGIEPILLLAQIVNFLIILFVLKKFFYKPIVKMLEERKTKIKESMVNADLIETRLKETEQKSAAILESARKNAQELMEDAKSQAQIVAQNAA
ncbi:MAG: ATP synthase F0 subunit B, partial [Candidatus Paceibacterales bacterium]